MNRVLAIFSLLILLLLSLLVFLVARPQAAPQALLPALAWLDRIGGGGSSTQPPVAPLPRPDADTPPASVSDPLPAAVSNGPDSLASDALASDAQPAGVDSGRDSIASVTVDGQGRAVVEDTFTASDSTPVDPASSTDGAVAPIAQSVAEANTEPGASPLLGATAALGDTLTRTPLPSESSPGEARPTGLLPSDPAKPDSRIGLPADAGVSPSEPRAPTSAADRAAKPASAPPVTAATMPGPGGDDATTTAAPGARVPPVASLLPPDAPAPRAPSTRAAQLQQSAIRNFLAGEVVEFEMGRDTLTPAGERVLVQVSDIIAQTRNTIIVVQGHTDDVGDVASNLELSQARALRARDYLIALGVDASRLRAQGFGESRPLVNNDSGAARKRNRRIDFTVVER